MKRSFLATVTSFVSLLLVSCGGGAPASLMLNDISADNYPKNSNIWIIEDTNATTSDFAGLNDAIVSLADSGREIELRLPNMTEIPDYAIYGEKRVATPSIKSIDAIVSGEKSGVEPLQALKSVDAPVAVSLGDFAFYGCENMSSFSAPQLNKVGRASLYECSGLTSISLPELMSVGELSFAYCSQLESVVLPKVKQIDALAFHVCHSLRTLDLATDSGAVLESVGGSDKGAFFNASTPEVVLTLGEGNKDLVSSNSLNVDSYNIQFKEIKIQNR